MFVDFDNIFSGLDEVDARAAAAFATRPGRWLAWIEGMVPATDDARIGETTERSVLVRNMYLNPSPYGRFRSDFTRAGFSVMDCPSLTLQGKSSADIRMVLDIVDTLGHETRFDEFIIFSGDADFTPVLQRLRAHDRRTAILAVNPAAQAYRSAADLQIDPDVFVEAALGLTIGGEVAARTPRAAAASPRPLASTPRPPAPTAWAPATVPRPAAPLPAVDLAATQSHGLEALSERVDAVIRANGAIPGGQLANVLRGFPGFTKDSRWLGHGTARRLAEAVVRRRPWLEISNSGNGDWTLLPSSREPLTDAHGQAGVEHHTPDAMRADVTSFTTEPTAGQTASTTAQAGGVVDPLATAEPDDARAPTGERSLHADVEFHSAPASEPALDAKIADVVAGLVDSASTPVSLAAAAQQVIHRFGEDVRRSRWGGHGSFKALIEHFTFEPPIEISNQGPGYLFDPERHQRPMAQDEMTLAGQSEALSTLARRISNVTGAPFLTPAAYVALFEALAHVAAQGVFQIGPASIAARDECAAHGFPVSRQNIQFVLKGISFAGYRVEERSDGHSAARIARVFRDNLAKLCSNAQLPLTDEEVALLDEWLGT